MGNGDVDRPSPFVSALPLSFPPVARFFPSASRWTAAAETAVEINRVKGVPLIPLR